MKTLKIGAQMPNKCSMTNVSRSLTKSKFNCTMSFIANELITK